MNILAPRSFKLLFFSSLVFAISSCTKKQNANDGDSDLSDLKNFQKEWVLVEDLAPPDSINRNYVIPD
jgi:hypothetical protein